NGRQVKVYDQSNLSRVRTITPFGYSAPGVTVAVGGGWLACGKIAGDGEVRVLNLQSLQLEKVFLTQTSASPKSGIGGTRLAWTESEPGQWELMVGSGSGWSASVEYWLSGTWNRREVKSEFSSWQGGIWVA
ncbi:MAG: hypothetical protein ACKO23_07055, partial [Gemmataceae bacterium]